MHQASGSARSRRPLSPPPPGTVPRTITRITCANTLASTAANLCVTRGDKSQAMKTESKVTAPTQFLEVNNETYAYRRFGNGSGVPLLFLQHFTGTLDNWDPAVTDPLATGQEV